MTTYFYQSLVIWHGVIQFPHTAEDDNSSSYMQLRKFLSVAYFLHLNDHIFLHLNDQPRCEI